MVFGTADPACTPQLCAQTESLTQRLQFKLSSLIGEDNLCESVCIAIALYIARHLFRDFKVIWKGAWGRGCTCVAIMHCVSKAIDTSATTNRRVPATSFCLVSFDVEAK